MQIKFLSLESFNCLENYKYKMHFFLILNHLLQVLILFWFSFFAKINKTYLDMRIITRTV